MTSDQLPILVVTPRDAGLFSLFNQVVGCIAWCAKHQRELYVDYRDRRFFYLDPTDEDSAVNGWEYYFQQPFRTALPDGDPAQRLVIHEDYHPFTEHLAPGFSTRDREWSKSPPLVYRRQMGATIQQYVRLQPIIAEEVDNLTENLFGDSRICGVHVRRTDSIEDSSKRPPRLTSYYHEIDRFREFLNCDHTDAVKVFLATDDEEVVEDFTRRYRDDLIVLPSHRSNDGKALHTNFDLPRREIGKQALIECLLLARTDHLVHSNSNLSTAALCWNPELSSTYLPPRATGPFFWTPFRQMLYRRWGKLIN